MATDVHVRFSWVVLLCFSPRSLLIEHLPKPKLKESRCPLSRSLALFGRELKMLNTTPSLASNLFDLVSAGKMMTLARLSCLNSSIR